jgi:hypothetical protein
MINSVQNDYSNNSQYENDSFNCTFEHGILITISEYAFIAIKNHQ